MSYNYGGGDTDTLNTETQAVLPSRNPFANLAFSGQTTPNAINGSDDFITRLLSNFTTDNLANTGSLLGSFSRGEQNDRLIHGGFAQNYDRLMQDAQTGRNQNEADALRKLYETGYITSGGFKPTNTSIQLNGQSRTLPSIGMGPQPASAAQKAGASALEGQLVDRLKPGGSYTPQPLSSYANPGLAERLSSYGAAGAGGLGLANNVLHPVAGSIIDDLVHKIPWGSIAGKIGSWF